MRNNPRIAGIAALAGACLIAAAGSHTRAQDAAAQPATSTTTAAPAPARPAPPADPQIESFKSLISGSWKASGKDVISGEDAEFWMHIAPVAIEGMDHTLYVEQSRADDPGVPHRQTIFQVYRNRGKVRMRTFEGRLEGFKPALGGGPFSQLWMVPDLFPAIDASDLIATLDLEFTPSTAGFDGKTPHPYPTALGGAVEMTSEMKLSKDRMVTTDKGFGPDGSEVWSSSGGSASSDSLTWERADPGFSVQRLDTGVVVITLDAAADGVQPVDGDTLAIDYYVWLGDGTMVDSSQKSGRLMQVPVPFAEGRLIKGFIAGLEGMNEGAVRRFIVPADQGYGPNPRGPIPGGSTLYFLVKIDTVQKPEPVVEDPAEAPEEGGAEPGTDAR
jgi:hypothetical protein